METIRRPLPGPARDDAPGASRDTFEVGPPGVMRLHSSARHGQLRSWGLLLAAILLGLFIALLGYDRPSPVAIGEPAAASQLGLDTGEEGAQAPGTADGGGDGSSSGPAATGSAGAVVHVVGDVAKPGVITLPVGARVADAVAAAGGALPDADLSGVNLARRVNDGEQIVVGVAPLPADPVGGASAGGPVAGGPAAGGPAAGGGASASGLINLNRATSDALEQLPRVGPVTAGKIIDYREQNGPFTSVEQLLEVPGIGEATLAGLRELVTV